MHGEWGKFGISEKEYGIAKMLAEEVALRCTIREFIRLDSEKDFLMEIGAANMARKGLKKMKGFVSGESKKEKKEKEKKFSDAERELRTLNNRISNRLKDWDKITSKGPNRAQGMLKSEMNKLKKAMKKYGPTLEKSKDKNHPAYEELNKLISSYSELAKKYSGKKKLKRGTKITDVLSGIGFDKNLSDIMLKAKNPWKGEPGGKSGKGGLGFFKGDTSITKRFDTILGKKSMQPMKIALGQIKSRKGTAAAFKHFMDELPPAAKKHLPLVLKDIVANLRK